MPFSYMQKRFQVFVSSTYQDLQEERQEVMHALLELDCIPSGMELFPAANESQWSLIRKVIDDCDYYVLVIGGRYGSIGPEGTSYTEMEYRYALSIDKPTIAFIHKSPGLIPANKSEDSTDGKAKLSAFRELVQQKLCKSWSSPADLGSVVSRSLIQLMKTSPAVGWVRANELPDREATLELLRLRQNVDDLKAELGRIRTTAPKGSESLAQGNDLFALRYAFRSKNETPRELKFDEFITSWNEIFAAIAPLMINEVAEQRLYYTLTDMAKGAGKINYDEFQILESDFQTIKIQLRALGLIVRSDRARAKDDTETYWTLTPYGDSLMTRLRAISRQGSSDSL
jgi:Domain of unknown function (DUF4062)